MRVAGVVSGSEGGWAGGQPGLAELRALVEVLLGGTDAQALLTEHQRLGEGVHRLRFEERGAVRSFVVKRLKPAIARRNQLVVERWLPAVGLGNFGPTLLGSVSERGGDCVWHVYDDLGGYQLNPRQACLDTVKIAVQLIARMHTRFAEHPLLGEVRLEGGDLGVPFLESNVRDAIYALRACPSSGQHARLRDRLLHRLCKLQDELPGRARAVDAWGGPETFLHGDLWAGNVLVTPTAGGLQPRLIDWDHAGVGPASYDLSTFLLRFPAERRSPVLEVYRVEVERVGWRLPPAQELNVLFETAEYARFANRVIWPAIALVQDGASWGWECLADVDQWFEDLQPVLPREVVAPATSFAQPGAQP